MLTSLKNHPFAVEAFFDSSLVLTFAIPKEQLQNLIPESLELDTYRDKWAFIAVAMVQTKDLRPKGFPKFMGNDFFLIGYRIFVKFTTSSGKRLRGLFILRSETNKKKMEFFGNIFTHYNYSTTDINTISENSSTKIWSVHSGFNVHIENPMHENIPLPAGSPFFTWKDARRFAGPLPFTFTYNSEAKEMLLIEGVREHWDPKPVNVVDYTFSFLDKLDLNDMVLANAFIIQNVPYWWKKGKTETWKREEEICKAF
jgi:hypothetical protein